MITAEQIKDALDTKLEEHWNELLDEEGRGATWMLEAAKKVIDKLFSKETT